MHVPGPHARRGPLGRLHPRIGLPAPGPALVQELGDLRELVHGVGLPSGNSSSPATRSPTFTNTLSRPSSRSHTDSAAKLPPSARHAPAAAARHASREPWAAAMPCANETTAASRMSSPITPG